jgi:hypothetical protein
MRIRRPIIRWSNGWTHETITPYTGQPQSESELISIVGTSSSSSSSSSYIGATTGAGWRVAGTIELDVADDNVNDDEGRDGGGGRGDVDVGPAKFDWSIVCAVGEGLLNIPVPSEAEAGVDDGCTFIASECGCDIVSYSVESDPFKCCSATPSPSASRASISSRLSSVRNSDSDSTWGRDRIKGGTRGCNNRSNF